MGEPKSIAIVGGMRATTPLDRIISNLGMTKLASSVFH